MFPGHALLTIYLSFVRPHLAYGDTLYDQPNNKSLCQKIETIQYNVDLAITDAITGSSQIKLYNDFGLKSLEFRQDFRKLCLFLKIKKTGLPEYLLNMIPQRNHRYNTPSSEDVTTSYYRTDVFKYSYFVYTILEWNKLDMQIRRSESFLPFKNSLLKIDQPTAKPTYNIHNPVGLKFLTRLRLGLSHLNENKYKHNFQDCVNLLCSYSVKIESLSHFFLHCHHLANIRATLLGDLQSADINFPCVSDNDSVDLLLYGSPNFNSNQNNKILSSFISFIIKSERFGGSLY